MECDDKRFLEGKMMLLFLSKNNLNFVLNIWSTSQKLNI